MCYRPHWRLPKQGWESGLDPGTFSKRTRKMSMFHVPTCFKKRKKARARASARESSCTLFRALNPTHELGRWWPSRCTRLDVCLHFKKVDLKLENPLRFFKYTHLCYSKSQQGQSYKGNNSPALWPERTKQIHDNFAAWYNSLKSPHSTPCM